MFTLEFSAVVAILVVACNANPLLRQSNMAPTSFNLNQLTNALRAQTALEMQLEQQKQRHEMLEMQQKALEEQNKMQLDMQLETLKNQLEQRQLARDAMQRNLLGGIFATGRNNLNTGAIQPTSLNNGLLNPAGTNAAGNNILTSGASTSNLLGSVPNTLTPNANLLGTAPTVNTFTNPFGPIVRLLHQAFAPQRPFASPNTRQGQSTFTQGIQQTIPSNNQRQSFLI